MSLLQIKDEVYEDEYEGGRMTLELTWKKIEDFVRMGNEMGLTRVPPTLDFMEKLFPNEDDRMEIVATMVFGNFNEEEGLSLDLFKDLNILYGLYKRIEGLETTIDTLKEGIAIMEKENGLVV